MSFAFLTRSLPFCTVSFLCVLLCLFIFRCNCGTLRGSPQKKIYIYISISFISRFLLVKSPQRTHKKRLLRRGDLCHVQADHLNLCTRRYISSMALAAVHRSGGRNGGECRRRSSTDQLVNPPALTRPFSEDVYTHSTLTSLNRTRVYQAYMN